MIIPYKYVTIDPEALQAIFMGQITHDDAIVVKTVMKRKRMKGLIGLIICVAVLTAIVAIIVLDGSWLDSLSVEVVLLFPIGLLAGIVFGLYFLTSYTASNGILYALKRCHPESVTRAHPLYNLGTLKKDKQLLDSISAKEFTAAEARGLLNIAESARGGMIRFIVFCFVMAIFLFILPILVEPIVISRESDPESVMRGISIFTRIFGAFFGLAPILMFIRLNTAMQYMKSIKSSYGLRDLNL